MSAAVSKFAANAKPMLRPVVRAILSRVPVSPSRLTGSLAVDGGKPVRNVRMRPWGSVADENLAQWHREVRSIFRRIFLSGVEGLPQPLAKQFAKQWAAYCGCRFGLLLTNGTDALRIALAAALDHDGLDYGGEVIVPNFSFVASAFAPLDRRFGVAFVDVDPGTLLLDPRRVEEAIIPGKTRAIMPVHLFGQPADMTALKSIADRHGLKIIEDAAQAHGSAWETGPVGSLGDVAGFSFQSTKNLASGEGGALTTNDEQVYERAFSIHNCGRSLVRESRWVHETLGWNCRATEYQAGLLIHRFENFQRMQARRCKNFEYLRTILNEVECLEPLTVDAKVRAHGMHMFAMRYDPNRCGGLAFQDFLRLVQAEGAPINWAYASTVSNQLAIQNLRLKHPQYFRLLATPVADQAARDVAFIPQQVFLGSTRDMEDIVAAVKKVERHCASSGANTI
ncbi:MAG TPA: DegT/DnrJ/EryC1/StrS family aminotransferase [Terracidiphilus sp.]